MALEDAETSIGQPSPLGPRARARIEAALFGQPAPAQAIGRYRITGRVGQGGMGSVLAGYDDELQRRVAIKLLRSGRASASLEQRLRREAQALARLSHPNVVQIYEVGEAGEAEAQLYLAMEFVEGEVLDAWQREPRTWRACVEVYLQAARGLLAAHERDLVHRDFKPANCILDRQGTVKVLDFGLARAGLGASLERTEADEALATDEASTHSAIDQPMTRTGAVLGTPAYMAPEQLEGQVAGPAADQFALCVSLYEAVHGRRPYGGHTAKARLEAIRAGRFQPLEARAGAPRWLQKLLRRGLACAPADRYPSLVELIAALEAGLGRRRRAMAASGALGVLTAAAAVAAWPDPDPCVELRSATAPAWTEDRRGALRSGLEAAPAGVRAYVEGGLDDYASGWIEQRAQLCEAERDELIGAEAHARAEDCLDRRMGRMGALVDALTRADASTLEYASEAVAALPALDDCAQVDRLLTGAELPPPELRARVAKVREGVDAAWAALDTGRRDAALALAEEARVSAEGLAWPQVRAELERVRARASMAMEQLGDADEALVAALEHAERAGDDPLVHDLLVDLTAVHVHAEQGAVAEAWSLAATSKLARIGEEPGRMARLRRWQSATAELGHDFEEAAALAREALELARSASAPEGPKVMRAAFGLGGALAALGRNDEALEAYAEALAVAEGVFGDGYPTGQVLYNRALVHAERGDDDAAAADYERAAAIFATSARTPAVDVADVHTAMLQLDLLDGELDAAAAHVAAAQAALDTLAIDDLGAQTRRADLAGLSASVEHFRGDYAAALRGYEAAIELRAALPDADPVWTAMLDSNRGECLLELGRLDDAEAAFSGAMGVLTAELGEDASELGYVLRGLGEVALERGALGPAAATLERALELRLAEPGDIDNLSGIQWALARALAPSDPERARALAKDARALAVELGASGAERRAAIEASALWTE
ncbi:serine/threonine kinase family protein [Plesiocystis pacifica SIR-1]|uniref:Serine/threonine kinase family protein n=1 Tax=Plesiocystis pacifica SIR-1 TaxID=391625 RepID=A6G0C0_9BACT|nr:serine/threonine-protein kinase [Plesiocystis pacifica]EDM80566.1 serine/threonine kinase family protein [Plesiocystis pacifica SIR-1]